MRALSLVLTLAGAAGACASLAGAAAAQGRPDTLAMACGQAQAIVQQYGEAVLGTGPYLFDRYVRSQAFCTWNEQTRASWVATRDSRQCFIGYRCVPADYDNKR